MGTNVSKQESSVLRKVVTDLSVEALNQNIQEDTDITTSTQIMKDLNFEGAIFNCVPRFIQNAVIEKHIYRKMTDEQAQSFNQDLQNKIEDQVTNLTEQKLQDLNLFQTNVSVVKNKFDSVNIADLSTDITSKVVKRINTSIDAYQQMQDINYKGVTFNAIPGSTDCELPFVQNVDIKSVTDNVVDSVLTNERISTIAQGATASITNDTSQTAIGINPMMFLLLLLLLPIIIIVIIVILIRHVPSVTAYFKRKTPAFFQAFAQKKDKTNFGRRKKY